MAEFQYRRSWWVRFVAHLSRQYFPGLDRCPYDEKVAERATAYLQALSREEGSFWFRVTLERALRQHDLLHHEAALVPAALALQKSFVELTDRYESVHLWIKQELSEAPISLLFSVIVEGARKEGASLVQIDFNPSSPDVAVLNQINAEWVEAMKLPISLATLCAAR